MTTDLMSANNSAPAAVRYGARKWSANGVPSRVAFRQSRLSPELLAALQRLPEFSASEERLVCSLGFRDCIDYPQLPKHRYQEGYFHTLETAETFKSLHPRNGVDFDKPAAPRLLRGFARAFRALNAEWIGRIAEAEGVPDIFRTVITRGGLFGDAAVQTHHGSEVDNENIGFHIDSVNSILHMAVSVRGARSLTSQLADSDDAEEFAHVREELSAGDVYLSSPFCFKHGVSYPESSWATRTVAVQLRTLLTFEEMVLLHNDEAALHALQDAVTTVLASADVQLPSLEEVEAAAEEIELAASEEAARNRCTIS